MAHDPRYDSARDPMPVKPSVALPDYSHYDQTYWELLESPEQSELDEGYQSFKERYIRERDDFLNGNSRYTVESSNIAWFEYNPDKEELRMGTTKGRVYLYFLISRFEAEEFYYAASKGKEVWARLRIRGSQKGSRKPFTRLA